MHRLALCKCFFIDNNIGIYWSKQDGTKKKPIMQSNDEHTKICLKHSSQATASLFWAQRKKEKKKKDVGGMKLMWLWLVFQASWRASGFWLHHPYCSTWSHGNPWNDHRHLTQNSWNPHGNMPISVIWPRILLQCKLMTLIFLGTHTDPRLNDGVDHRPLTQYPWWPHGIN